MVQFIDTYNITQIITYLVEILTGWMILRSAYLAYFLWKDWQESSSRAFGYFFAGLALGAIRAMVLIPITEPPLWNLIWQVIAYFFIVLGLEKIYGEIKNEYK